MEKSLVTRTIGNAKLNVKKNEPKILVYGGIIAGAMAGVWACKQSTKVPDIKRAYDIEIENVNYTFAEGDITEEETKRAIAVLKANEIKDIAKLYAGPLLTFSGSALMIKTGFGQQVKRTDALSVLTAVQAKNLATIGATLASKYGPEEARKILHNVNEIETEATVTDEKGKKKKIKNKIEVVDPSTNVSPYSKFFDASSKHWKPSAEANLRFLQFVQKSMNAKLISEGHLFLNDVYEALDIPITAYGQMVGWIYDDENPAGDNAVDFGIYEYNVANRRFVNGIEPVMLLDFNVDGNILKQFPDLA